MAFFNHFPYTNFHELNLDWILAKIMELEAIVSDVPTEGGLDAVRAELEALRGQLREAVADLERDIDGLTASDVGALPNTVTKLPSPASLTFTGAAAGSYDGSQAVTIDIPAGGGGGISAPLNFTGRQTASYDGSQAVDINLPEKLASPNALTFTGGVTATYDGSAPLTVNIPTGGSGEVQNQPLNFTGAVTASYDGSEQIDVHIPVTPTALPNPNALTFTGAVTGTYDGSAPLSVIIPQGGSGVSGIYSHGGIIYVNTAWGQGSGTVHVTTDINLNWGDILFIEYAAQTKSNYSGSNMYTATCAWTIDGRIQPTTLTAIEYESNTGLVVASRTVQILNSDQGGLDIVYGSGYKATLGGGAATTANNCIGIYRIWVLKRND